MFVFCVFLCGSVFCVLCVLWLRLWLVDGGVGQKAETMLTGMTSDQDHPEHNVAYLQVIRVKTWCSSTSSMKTSEHTYFGVLGLKHSEGCMSKVFT